MKGTKYDLTKRKDIDALIKFLEAKDGYSLTTTENRHELLDDVVKHNADVSASREKSQYDLKTTKGVDKLLDDVVENNKRIIATREKEQQAKDNAQKPDGEEKDKYDFKKQEDITRFLVDLVEHNKKVIERKGITPPPTETTAKNDYSKQKAHNTAQGRSKIEVFHV